MNWKSAVTPLSREFIGTLHARDTLLLSGVIYSARDRAHERICAMAAGNESPPFELRDQLIYYMGPSPAPPNRPVGAAGPTTSGRMDPFVECMLELGVCGFIGKGRRSDEVRALLSRHRAVYFASFGGAAAYLSAKIEQMEPVAFEDLGPEAVYRLQVKDFPLIVINDIHGGDGYEASL